MILLVFSRRRFALALFQGENRAKVRWLIYTNEDSSKKMEKTTMRSCVYIDSIVKMQQSNILYRNSNDWE